MTANVTALHAGRTRALVQRKRRKMHVASIAASETHWLTLCDRDVLADGADFWVHDADTVIDEHAEQLCTDCYRLVFLATLLVEHGVALPVIRKAAAR